MPASVHYSIDENLIRVRESGVVSSGDFTDSIQKIRELHDQEGCSRVLVNATEQVIPTEGVEAYDRASLAARQLSGTGIRIAVIVTQALLDGHEFFEVVSQNRGLTLQVFSDEAAAREWLGN